jgi:long-chain acyl-CoA synthetase
MIKAKGANVAPPEIEAVLEALPELEHAFVFGVPTAEHDEEIVAVVVPRDGAAVDPDRVRHAARERLSAFKVPRTVHVLPPDEVPWLATGKPDKRAMRRLLGPA